jgi:hypothetical protein
MDGNLLFKKYWHDLMHILGAPARPSFFLRVK